MDIMARSTVVEGGEFPEVKIGSLVRASARITDIGQEVAIPDDVGLVLAREPGCYPTVLWLKTGRVCDSIPNDEFALLPDESEKVQAASAN